MTNLKTLRLILLGAALALVLPVIAFASRTLSTDYRYGAQFDEWFVRGDADVTESPTFDNGIRLAAFDGRDEREVTRLAVASAVYFFQVPAEAESVAIDIGYKSTDVPGRPDVAGLLFVRDTSVEQQYATQTSSESTPVEDPTFFGNTYLLPSDQIQLKVELPTRNHVVNGVLELHLSASAGEALDVQYVQVTTGAAEPPPVYVNAVPSVQYVTNPYDYSYAYYYLGPWYYPTGGYYSSFYLFDSDINPFYWGGISTYRACFYTYHPWYYRPTYYTYTARFVYFPVYSRHNECVDYRYNWYDHHYRTDVRHHGEHDIDRDFRHRAAFVSDSELPTFRDGLHRIAGLVGERNSQVRQAFGDRFRDRLTAWRSNPTEARHDLLRWTSDDSPIRQAIQQWRSIPAERRDAMVQNRVTDLRDQAATALQNWRDRREQADATPEKPAFVGPRSVLQGLTDRGGNAADNGRRSFSGLNNWRSGGGLSSTRDRGTSSNNASASSSSGLTESRGQSWQALQDRVNSIRENVRERRDSGTTIQSVGPQSSSMLQGVFNRRSSGETGSSNAAGGTASNADKPTTLRDRIQSFRDRGASSSSSVDKPSTGSSTRQFFGNRSSDAGAAVTTPVPDARATVRDRIQSFREQKTPESAPNAASRSLGSRMGEFMNSRRGAAESAGATGGAVVEPRSTLRERIQSFRERTPSEPSAAITVPNESRSRLFERFQSNSSRSESNPVIIPDRTERTPELRSGGANDQPSESITRDFGRGGRWGEDNNRGGGGGGRRGK